MTKSKETLNINRNRIVGECEKYQEERNVVGGGEENSTTPASYSHVYMYLRARLIGSDPSPGDDFVRH